VRTLVVTHYFPPEIGAPQARLSELARFWTEAGDDVVVLTGMPNHPTGIVPPAYRRRLRSTEHVDGYRVERVWLYATPNEGFVKKTLGHLSFMVSGPLLAGRRVGGFDAVVVSSPTFFSIASAWLLARWKRARFVVEIRDLWPAIFVELGVLTNRHVISLLERLELAAYRAADEVIVVTEGFRQDLIARGVPAAKVHTIRNGVDLDRFDPSLDHDRASTRKQLGVADDAVLVAYLGAHGISHGLDTVIEAAAQLEGARTDLTFVLVGEGSAKADLARDAARRDLSNLRMLPGVPRDQVPEILAVADICLVPLRDIPLFATFIPSKIFEYLGAGRPVIGAVRGEPAEILEAAGAVVVEPGDATALAGAIADLADDPARCSAMGERGRAYVAEHSDRRRLAERYRELLMRAGTS
jgi:glycosyltransferase involved in cell wall biosynthesis